MKGGAIGLLVLAGLMTLVGVLNIITRAATRPDRVQYLGGYAVGSLFTPVVLVILGSEMWSKANRDPDSDPDS
jgi:hypothetical protein